MEELKTIEDLKAIAFKITRPIQVKWPQFANKYETLTPYLGDDVDKGFYQNNGIVVFVEKRIMYVIPYFRQVMLLLSENGFLEKCMYVPFSNWDIPVEEENVWKYILSIATEKRKADIKNDFIKISMQHGFGELPAVMLEEKCLLIPDNGIKVSNMDMDTRFYPQCTQLSSYNVQKLGKYTLNNGTCVFIYRDGSTYVTRSTIVISALKSANYVEGYLFVPFSNGERILDPVFADKWNKINH